MMTKPVTKPLISLAVIPCLCVAIQATEVTHSTLGTLHNDTFESQPLGPAPNAGGALPSITPGPGHWHTTLALRRRMR